MISKDALDATVQERGGDRFRLREYRKITVSTKTERKFSENNTQTRDSPQSDIIDRRIDGVYFNNASRKPIIMRVCPDWVYFIAKGTNYPLCKCTGLLLTSACCLVLCGTSNRLQVLWTGIQGPVVVYIDTQTIMVPTTTGPIPQFLRYRTTPEVCSILDTRYSC